MLTPKVKNGWSFSAYLCEANRRQETNKREAMAPADGEAISSCGAWPVSGDVSLKGWSEGEKRRLRGEGHEKRLACCPAKPRRYLLLKAADYSVLPFNVNGVTSHQQPAWGKLCSCVRVCVVGVDWGAGQSGACYFRKKISHKFVIIFFLGRCEFFCINLILLNKLALTL